MELDTELDRDRRHLKKWYNFESFGIFIKNHSATIATLLIKSYQVGIEAWLQSVSTFEAESSPSTSVASSFNAPDASSLLAMTYYVVYTGEETCPQPRRHHSRILTLVDDRARL